MMFKNSDMDIVSSIDVKIDHNNNVIYIIDKYISNAAGSINSTVIDPILNIIDEEINQITEAIDGISDPATTEQSKLLSELQENLQELIRQDAESDKINHVKWQIDVMERQIDDINSLYFKYLNEYQKLFEERRKQESTTIENRSKYLSDVISLRNILINENIELTRLKADIKINPLDIISVSDLLKMMTFVCCFCALLCFERENVITHKNSFSFLTKIFKF